MWSGSSAPSRSSLLSRTSQLSLCTSLFSTFLTLTRPALCKTLNNRQLRMHQTTDSMSYYGSLSLSYSPLSISLCGPAPTLTCLSHLCGGKQCVCVFFDSTFRTGAKSATILFCTSAQNGCQVINSTMFHITVCGPSFLLCSQDRSWKYSPGCSYGNVTGRSTALIMKSILSTLAASLTRPERLLQK